MTTPTIIGTSSFAQSGGSALTNILEEFSNISILKGGAEFECKFFAENIFPLETALLIGGGVDKAVKTFLHNAKIAATQSDYKNNFGQNFLQYTKEYLDSVTENYLGGVHKTYDFEFVDNDEAKIFSNARHLFHYLYGNRRYSDVAYEPYTWEPQYTPFGPVYYGEFTDDFYEKTYQYLEKVFAPLYEEGKNYILGDTLYTADVTTPQELKYFRNSKVLISNRDPRDLYVANKEIYGEWFIPTWTVETWIKYYKYRRRSIKMQKQNNSENILHLQFESLIYDYDASIAKIKNFLNLSDEQHIRKGQVFIPEKSKTNTQLFRKYTKYARDIEKIERGLPEFCYPYTQEQLRNFSATEIKSTEIKSLESIRKEVYIFQKTGKLPFSNIKGAFMFMMLFKNIGTFKNRRGIKSYIKGIIKIGIGVLFFPIDFIRSLIKLKRYQKKNKNKIIEFK